MAKAWIDLETHKALDYKYQKALSDLIKDSERIKELEEELNQAKGFVMTTSNETYIKRIQELQEENKRLVAISHAAMKTLEGVENKPKEKLTDLNRDFRRCDKCKDILTSKEKFTCDNCL